MAANDELIVSLYAAMDRHDGEAMARLYAPDGRFRDPAFGELSGAEAGDMWRMLTGRAEDLRVELLSHTADDERGEARWVARYTFTPTGRPVVNDVRARLRFGNGLIVEHVDSFSFWRWARQALGPAGYLLGLPGLSAAVRRRARKDLAEFRDSR